MENADYFSIEYLRLSYIVNRLEDVLANRALTRFSPRSLNLYKIAQNVFDYLLSIYENSHRVVTAEIKFQTLKQNFISFREFYAEFDHLAIISKLINQHALKKQLNYKLNIRL